MTARLSDVQKAERRSLRKTYIKSGSLITEAVRALSQAGPLNPGDFKRVLIQLCDDKQRAARLADTLITRKLIKRTICLSEIGLHALKELNDAQQL